MVCGNLSGEAHVATQDIWFFWEVSNRSNAADKPIQQLQLLQNKAVFAWP